MPSGKIGMEVLSRVFQLKHFEFAGKIVGKCLYESALGGAYRQLVRARLARSFLAQIIGLRVHYKVRALLLMSPTYSTCLTYVRSRL